MSAVLVRHTSLWVAWYPARRLRCQARASARRRYLEIALGPAYVCVGPGRPDV